MPRFQYKVIILFQLKLKMFPDFELKISEHCKEIVNQITRQVY